MVNVRIFKGTLLVLQIPEKPKIVTIEIIVIKCVNTVFFYPHTLRMFGGKSAPGVL